MSETMDRLAWGLQPPAGTKAAWGARACYTFSADPERLVIDLLWDRQDAFGSREEREELSHWLNTEGLAKLRAELVRYRIGGDSDARATVRHGAFAIDACPRQSYGYLYIVAYLQPAAGAP